MSRRTVVTTLFLIIIAVSTWFVAENQQPKTVPEAKSNNQADYWAHELDFTVFDISGQPNWRVITSKLLHFDDQSMSLDKPRYTFFRQDQPPWFIEADTGWTSPDGQLMRLEGRVIIHREGYGLKAPMRIATTDVRVRPKRDYAETDSHIRVDRGRDWLESDGGQIWFSEPVRMKFLSRVKALYNPPRDNAPTPNQQ